MKKIFVVLFVVLVTFFLISGCQKFETTGKTIEKNEEIKKTDWCEKDEDCTHVPSCCFRCSAPCIHKSKFQEVNCSRIKCPKLTVKGFQCKCINNKCVAAGIERC